MKVITKKILFEVIFCLSEFFAKLLFKKNVVYIFGTGLVYGPRTMLKAAIRDLLTSRQIKIKKKLLNKYINNEGVIMDVGANIGHTSLFFSKILNKKIHSFEPYLVNFEYLKKNTKKIKNIHIHNFGLSNKEGELEFGFRPYSLNFENTGQITAIVKHNEKLTKKRISEVFNGDNWVKKNLPSTRISLIKIDVEGMEVLVLEGLLKTIKKYKPMLIIEYSPLYHNAYFYKEVLMKHYNFYYIKKNKLIEFNFNSDILVDMFLIPK
tara:strand:- start:157 stop:951 length:795 start_codon:yes stop_codon:yes gene_type:complete